MHISIKKAEFDSIIQCEYSIRHPHLKELFFPFFIFINCPKFKLLSLDFYYSNFSITKKLNFNFKLSWQFLLTTTHNCLIPVNIRAVAQY